MMKLDEDDKIVEPKLGDAELIRLDFDCAGITLHIKLRGPDQDGEMFILRIVNPRWFSFTTNLGQNVIDEIVITHDLKDAAAIAPDSVRDLLRRRQQTPPGQTTSSEPLKAIYISPIAGPEMTCIADDVVTLRADVETDSRT